MFKAISLILFLNFTFAVFLPAAGRAMSIDEAVALTLKNNPDLQSKQMNRMMSESDLSEKESRNFGKFEVIASYGYYNLPRTLAPLTPASIFSDPFAVPTTRDLFTTGIMYEVPLFTGFAQQHSVEIASMQRTMPGLPCG